MNNIIIKCGIEEMHFSSNMTNIDFNSANYKNRKDYKNLINILNESYKICKTKCRREKC